MIGPPKENLDSDWLIESTGSVQALRVIITTSGLPCPTYRSMYFQYDNPICNELIVERCQYILGRLSQ